MIEIRGPSWDLVFPERAFAITIGRGEPSELHLPSRLISRAHCRLEEQHGRAVITDLGSTSGTYVNDRRVSGSVELATGNRLTIADLPLRFVRVTAAPFAPSDATEAALVAEIAAGDRASLLVYADWLEQRDDSARATYVRALHDLRGWDFARRAAFGELAARVHPAWRLALS